MKNRLPALKTLILKDEFVSDFLSGVKTLAHGGLFSFPFIPWPQKQYRPYPQIQKACIKNIFINTAKVMQIAKN
ncbi:hypothetical protein [Desulfosarcina sp.]|uniref:hypothetical protein n=1 Tax=Desulfosarcina sp. TaxID=2027861 RepID=UPI003970FD8E